MHGLERVFREARQRLQFLLRQKGVHLRHVGCERVAAGRDDDRDDVRRRCASRRQGPHRGRGRLSLRHDRIDVALDASQLQAQRSQDLCDRLERGACRRLRSLDGRGRHDGRRVDQLEVARGGELGEHRLHRTATERCGRVSAAGDRYGAASDQHSERAPLIEARRGSRGLQVGMGRPEPSRRPDRTMVTDCRPRDYCAVALSGRRAPRGSERPRCGAAVPARRPAPPPRLPPGAALQSNP